MQEAGLGGLKDSIKQISKDKGVPAGQTPKKEEKKTKQTKEQRAAEMKKKKEKA